MYCKTQQTAIHLKMPHRSAHNIFASFNVIWLVMKRKPSVEITILFTLLFWHGLLNGWLKKKCTIRKQYRRGRLLNGEPKENISQIVILQTQQKYYEKRNKPN